MAKNPPIPSLVSEILDLRYRLIVRERRIDDQVSAILSEMILGWEREIRRILGGRSAVDVSSAVVGRRAAILSGIRKITTAELRKVIDTVKSEAASVYTDNAYRISSILSGVKATTIAVSGVSFSAIDVPTVRAAIAGPIAGLSEIRSIGKIPARVESLMRKDLARSIADGYRVDQLVSKWRDRLGAGVVASEVRSLARTAIMSASNAAHLDNYRKNRDLIPMVRWEATFDRRTCVRCGSLHGRTFPVGDAPPIPAHLQCRCVLIPVFADSVLNSVVQGVGAYRSPSGGTYFRNKDRGFERFLRSRTPDFRADFFPSMLKREVFEKGRLSLADMVSRDGSIKTDDQIRRMLTRKR